MFRQFSLLICAVLMVVSPALAAGGKIKVKPASLLFQVPRTGGKSVTCLFQDNKIISGTATAGGKRFTPTKVSKALKISKFKELIKVSSDAEEISSLKKKISKIKAEIKLLDQICLAEYSRPVPTPAPCEVTATEQSLELTENETAEISIAAASNCPKELMHEIVTPPSNGEAHIEEGKIIYRAGYGDTNDLFKARACHENPRECSSDVSIQIKGNSGEFVGRADKLEPYRSFITEREARHLIKQLAMNDRSILTADLLSDRGYDLSALVNKMLDPHLVAPDLKRQLQIFRDGMQPHNGPSPVPLKDAFGQRFFSSTEQFSSVAEQSDALERFVQTYFTGYNSNITRLHYAWYYTPSAPYFRARYGSPSWQLMANFWFGHFGTALHNFGGYEDEWHIRDYIDLIGQNALGNFKDLLLGADRAACMDDQPGGGILCDAAGTKWLNNHENTYLNRNQNFAREFLELYLLGPNDLVSDNANYDELDIVAATAYLSGFKVDTYYTPKGHGNDANTLVPRHKIVWDPSRHDFADYTAFRDTPYELSGTYTPLEFAEHIIDNHPGMPRFIAGKIFRFLAYRDPSEEMVAALADSFKKDNFDIAKLFFKIGTSEAMFSEKAFTPKCVKEPYRIFSETFRSIRLPLIYNGMFRNFNANHYGGINNWTVSSLFNLMYRAGEYLLLYDSVFTYDYCGRKPDTYGADFLPAEYMLSKTQTLIQYLAWASWANNEVFNFNDLLPELLTEGEQIFAITPSRVIDFYNKMYAIELSEAERNIIYDYLTTRLNDQNIPIQSGWNASDRLLMSEKLAGLTVIYFSMSQSNVY